MTIDESQTVELDDLNLKVVFVAEENCVCTLHRCTDEESSMLASANCQQGTVNRLESS
jgi:hypothetical protein